MAAVVKAIQRLFGISSTQKLRPIKPCFDFSRFAEGDRVYINGKKPRLSKPLEKGGEFGVRDGFILHNEIIGATPSQRFVSNKGKTYQISLPDLDTYISSMPRKVTPVYGTYANYIVSLFDIHVVPPTSAKDDQPKLEILDTGTGHGSVTLHLARAIQAANPPLPDVDAENCGAFRTRSSAGLSHNGMRANEAVTKSWQEWRANRRAVVHSVEISPVYSRHAEHKVVAGFRRGLYSPHIDFHVANVHEWIDRQLGQREHQPFLSYVFLDMPGCHRYLGKIASAMRENALVAVFAPSITQIGECVRVVKTNQLPLRMEKALELGDGISNGRLWDVRLTVKKANDPMDELSMADTRTDGEGESSLEEVDSQTRPAASSASEEEEGSTPSLGASERPVMVCRPKVGERIIGGGFVGLWRREGL